MRCPECQHENLTEAAFCEECGARLAAPCSACGAGNLLTSRFCPQCGVALVPPALTAAFTSPVSYTPPHLAQKILISKNVLEGERKQVTVLFADVKGSMEILADRDPEEVRTILDPVLELMMEAVHYYEGTVNQVMGDGIMALFGAPVAHEDHAVRACYAALRTQKSVEHYAEEVRREHGVSVRVRVGLNSGEVVVRSISNDLQMDYSAVGQTTHLAARMEQLAEPGRILLTAKTLLLAEGYVEVRPLGPILVKGQSTPVEVYELNTAGRARRRFEVAARRGLSRFVGRDAELAELEAISKHAAQGAGQIVGIVGEPGVGKSRLVHEFVNSPCTQGWLILQSGAVSYGKASPYLAVKNLLKGYFEIDTDDDAGTIREKVIGNLRALDRTLEPERTPLLALLDVPTDDAHWEAVDPPGRRQRTIDVICRLLLRVSQGRPLLLVFEDLQWIDSETQAVLDSLVKDALPDARVLLVANYRPEYEHSWHTTYYTQLRIDPLPPASAEQLLAGILGNDPMLHDLKQLLIARTEGNPFFLEECARTLTETQVVVGPRGAYRVASPVKDLVVPSTVHAVLAARIDRLTEDERWLLQAAAVIGKDLPFALLNAIADTPEDELRRRLARLQGAEFLYETRPFPDLEYTFKHALTHEVAYQSLLSDRRRALHAQIAATMETLYADRLSEHVDRLARHAFRGEVWDKAVTYLRRAGERALRSSANQEGAEFFEDALSALRHLPETPSALEHAIDIRLNLRDALWALARLVQIQDHLRETERLAEALGDRRRSGWVACYLCQYSWSVVRLDAALEAGERALAIAEGLPNAALHAETSFYLSLVHLALGDAARSAAILSTTLRTLDQVLESHREEFPSPRFAAHGSILVRGWMARVLAELGEFAEAETWGHEAIQLGEAANSPFALTSALAGLGASYVRKGQPEQAVGPLERGLELCRTYKFNNWLPTVAASLGNAYVSLGQIDPGLALLEEAVGRGARTGIMSSSSLWLVYLGEAYLRAHRTSDALATAHRAVALCREHLEAGYEAWALRLLGEIAANADPPNRNEAEARYLEASALAERLGMRPLVARCQLGLGQLNQRMGDHSSARTHLRRAAELFRALAMPLVEDPGAV
jgi:class 3 adenylate cyclase/tetratricopeptide (TPR) repeat protein